MPHALTVPARPLRSDLPSTIWCNPCEWCLETWQCPNDCSLVKCQLVWCMRSNKRWCCTPALQMLFGCIKHYLNTGGGTSNKQLFFKQLKQSYAYCIALASKVLSECFEAWVFLSNLQHRMWHHPHQKILLWHRASITWCKILTCPQHSSFIQDIVGAVWAARMVDQWQDTVQNMYPAVQQWKPNMSCIEAHSVWELAAMQSVCYGRQPAEWALRFMCCCTMLQNLDMPFDALLSTTVGCGMTKAILWWHNCTTLQNHS